jgi:putative protease
MADVLSRETGIPAVTIVYSPIAVITSRIPMRLRGPQPVLENEKGETLQLDFSIGLTVVYGGNDFSLLGRLNELYAMGCENFMLDLSRPGVLTRQYQSIMTAFHNNRTLPDTTPVNFDRGLE